MTRFLHVTAVVLLGASALGFILFDAPPASAQASGELSVTPDRGVAGHFGTWTVTYRVGERGIEQGGGLRVQLPDAWHADDRNSAYPLQSSRPTDDHYVEARTSAEGVELQTTVESEPTQRLAKGDRAGLDGRKERYVFVTRVEIAKGRLETGDSISVVYGETSDGSRGLRAGIVSTPPEPILAAVDHTGGGEYELHPDRPEMSLQAGPLAKLLVSGPSHVAERETAELRVSLLDQYFNPVRSYEGPVRFEVVKGSADVPTERNLDLDQGWTTVEFTPRETGILRMETSVAGGLYEATVNPIKVTDEPASRQVYWGDLHSHSKFSWDGVGSTPFEYARNVADLDFYSLTDHSIPANAGHTHGLGQSVWDEYTHMAEHANDPHEFVTLHAYEASFGSPYGHHNVFFRGEPGPLLVSERYESPDSIGITLPEMWDRLEEGRALTIPHHTGKMPNPVRWAPQDSSFRRNFEIYSGHGLSEAYDPQHPLAFEQSNFTSPSTSVDGPQFAQNAWAQGLILSTIAASDDHRAQPGKPHFGLTAVRSPSLTRPDIFDALYERNTYGTTGARILLDFTVDGHAMGSQIAVESSPRLEVEVHGTDVIQGIEILRYSQPAGGFEVVHRLRPDALDVSWSRVDRTFRDDSIYYVRVKQRGVVQGRAAMAWSSPIWVDRVADN